MRNSINTWSLMLIVSVFITSCSSKLSNPNIDKLETQEQVLKRSTELNNTKLELEKEKLRNANLVSDVDNINKQASASSERAKDLSARLSRNPGDQSLSRKADNAAKESARDAKRARKLNNDLDKSTTEIRNLERKIKDLESELDEMKSKVEFVPNQNN
ncbi:hypothetical protein [Daejeonella oryzae]|uniref:hypothetical protein n=1 Tax=Daejeonella oryzae TaxID=1122943 RepID=UPI0004291582|nr:hypothetical protein [Daejeonella oryzae]